MSNSYYIFLIENGYFYYKVLLLLAIVSYCIYICGVNNIKIHH